MPRLTDSQFDELLELQAAIEAKREADKKAEEAEHEANGTTPRPRSGEPGWKPSRLSWSMAGTYEQCPRRWKYDYILGTRVGTPLPAMIGSFAHEVLEFLYMEEPENRTLETAKDIAQFLWPTLEEDEHYINHNMNREQANEFKRAVWANIVGLFEMENPEEVKVLATEQKLTVVVDGTPMTGAVDRIDETKAGLKVVDYKTGGIGPERYRRKKLKQAFLYSAMVREELGLEPTHASLVYTSEGETIDGKVTDKAMEGVTKEMGETWVKIHSSMEKDDFEPRTGPLCSWCDHVAKCPEGQSEVRYLHSIDRVRADAPGLKILGLA